MINGVLVEMTVKSVVPALKTNAEGLKKVLDDLVKQYKTKQDELEQWKVRQRMHTPYFSHAHLSCTCCLLLRVWLCVSINSTESDFIVTSPHAEKEQCPSCSVMRLEGESTRPLISACSTSHDRLAGRCHVIMPSVLPS